jgi:hypothetical protein
MQNEKRSDLDIAYFQRMKDERDRIIELIEEMKAQGYHGTVLIMLRERINRFSTTNRGETNGGLSE